MSNDLDKDDLDIIDSVFKRMEELNIEYEKERQMYLKASREEKLKLMQKEVSKLVGLFAYHGQFRGTNALEELAGYEEYEKRYFSEVENQQQNYIEYLKCYCNGYNQAALCCDFDTQEQIDLFIKEKCEKYGLLNILEGYINER